MWAWEKFNDNDVDEEDADDFRDAGQDSNH